MGKNTKIEWTGTELPDGTVVPGHTFNPWIGCAHVSPGCANCYAENLMDTRYSVVKWGVDGTRKKTIDNYWKQPYKWNREALETGTRRKVFCGSLCDVFEDRQELFAWRRDLYKLIEETPHLDWLLLTKRPGQIRRLGLHYAAGWPDNVWLGTSVENQATADLRIPLLLDNKAVLYWLSLEPLLGPVDLDPFFWASQASGFKKRPKPGWVIVGGESGATAREFDVDWMLDICDQCWNAQVPVFSKQLGSNPVYNYKPIPETVATLTGKADDVTEWPEEWRVREYPRAVKDA